MDFIISAHSRVSMNEKINKYLNFVKELKTLWNMKETFWMDDLKVI